MAVNGLKTLQQRFKRAVAEPGTRQSPAWLGIKDTPPIPYERRLNIYQYAYFARLHESLADDFSWLEKVLGIKEFEKLCRAFLAKYPSRYSSLAEVGRRLPQFLRAASPWKKKPGLAILADFEWECFVADNVANPDKHTAIATRGVFVLHPAVRLFQSPWEVDRTGPKRGPRKSAKPIYWLIFRDGEGDVSYRRLAVNQFEILKLIRDGEPLERLVTEFEKRNVSQKRASQWFQSWAQQQIISGVQHAGSGH